MGRGTEIKSTTDGQPYGDNIAAGPVLSWQLDEMLQALRSGAEYARGDPSSRILLKEPSLRIVLLALKQGGRMREHDASGPVALQQIEGRARIRVADSECIAERGRLITIEPRIRHEVEALSDCALLIFIGLTHYEVHSKPHSE